jgi:hypothetical protein
VCVCGEVDDGKDSYDDDDDDDNNDDDNNNNNNNNNASVTQELEEDSDSDFCTK